MKSELKYKKYFRGELNSYKKLLLHDLKTNRKYSNLADLLFFSKNGASAEWIEALDSESFFDSFKSSSDLSKNLKSSWVESDIQKIDFDSQSLEMLQDQPYAFFTKREFTTIEEVEKEFPGFYYVFGKDFFEKIDITVLNHLSDYCEVEKGSGVYKKKISDNASINIKRHFHYTAHSGVEEYLFPDISVELNEEEFYFFRQPDTRSFLFLPGTSFIFFYVESNSITYTSDKQIVGVTRKHDQPVVYRDAEGGKFTVSNKMEKLAYYNKYILLLVELYDHYFRVFEKWLIEQVIHHRSQRSDF